MDKYQGWHIVKRQWATRIVWYVASPSGNIVAGPFDNPNDAAGEREHLFAMHVRPFEEEKGQ